MHSHQYFTTYKTLPSPKLIEAICNLVFTDNRAMPAHYTSNGGTQSFCVDFDGIQEDDEYQMASVAFYQVHDYMEDADNLSDSDRAMIIRCGEDLMISSYILHTLERVEVLEEVIEWLTQANLEGWPVEEGAERVFGTESARKWFAFCVEYGGEVATKARSI